MTSYPEKYVLRWDMYHRNITLITKPHSDGDGETITHRFREIQQTCADFLKSQLGPESSEVKSVIITVEIEQKSAPSQYNPFNKYDPRSINNSDKNTENIQ